MEGKIMEPHETFTWYGPKYGDYHTRRNKAIKRARIAWTVFWLLIAAALTTSVWIGLEKQERIEMERNV